MSYALRQLSPGRPLGEAVPNGGHPRLRCCRRGRCVDRTPSAIGDLRANVAAAVHPEEGPLLPLQAVGTTFTRSMRWAFFTLTGSTASSSSSPRLKGLATIVLGALHHSTDAPGGTFRSAPSPFVSRHQRTRSATRFAPLATTPPSIERCPSCCRRSDRETLVGTHQGFAVLLGDQADLEES